MLDNDIKKLIYIFSKLPGLGPRSAKRLILHLIANKHTTMVPLANTLNSAINSIKICHNCGNLDVYEICNICTNTKRDQTTICVVESVADLWAMDRNNIFKGLFHVLSGTLSAVEGRGPRELNIHKLVERISKGQITEVILATNATIDGQTTAFFISEKLAPFNIKITRLAQGVPMGGELDYLDDGTLEAALFSRKDFG